MPLPTDNALTVSTNRNVTVAFCIFGVRAIPQA